MYIFNFLTLQTELMISRLNRIEDSDVTRAFAEKEDQRITEEVMQEVHTLHEALQQKLQSMQEVNEQLEERLKLNETSLQVSH